MGYTIALHKDCTVKKERIISALLAKLSKSPFKCELQDGSAPPRKYAGSIAVMTVRLREKKLYCGNHPGECAVGPKRKATYLEWDDWVEFNGLVNDVLDKLKANADVWSLPQDVNGKMWIRKGTQRRFRYEWEDDTSEKSMMRIAFGNNPIRIWNQGTPDQFQPMER